MMNKPKFNLGDRVFHVQSSCLYGKKTLCVVCFGNRKVTVILGNGEHVDTECQHCAVGIESPSGYSTTWEPHAHIYEGTITGVTHEYDGWTYKIDDYRVLEREVFATYDEAAPVMEIETQRGV